MKEKLAMRKPEGCQRAISKPPKLLPRIHNSTKHVSTEKRFHLNLLIYNTLTEMTTKSIKKTILYICRYRKKPYLCIAFEKQSNYQTKTIRGVAQSG